MPKVKMSTASSTAFATGAGTASDLEADRAGFLDRDAVLDDLHRLGRGAALQLEAAVLVDEMRAHADVAHYRHARIRDRANDVRLVLAALHLHDVGAAFLHQPQRVRHAQLRRGVAAVGH